MNVGRRNALKAMVAGGALAAAKAVPVEASRVQGFNSANAIGMLYDTTLCIGCKSCVVACREANNLTPTLDADRLHQAPVDLDSHTKNVIKLYKAADGPERSYVKAQCMHCIDPACAASCMLGSLHKDAVTGIVSYDVTYCVGCRYCMMSCPFDCPKFEYETAVPKIVKCELCRHRVAGAALADDGGFSRYPKAHGPACCEVCPRGAVIYGKRSELLREARQRLTAGQGRYVQKIYGETDGGGTQVLYLSHIDFEKIGLPDLPGHGVPETAYSIQETLYKGFAAPVALYGILGIVMLRNRKKNDNATTPSPAKGGRP
jgi:Fe-S-cluster-containing dehydrogenase component